MQKVGIGVRVLFTPKRGMTERLREKLRAEVADLGDGDCPAALRVSMREGR